MPKRKAKVAVWKDIRIDANGNVDLPNCPVSKKDLDEVRWASDYGPWHVEFPNSPFAESDFYVPAGKKSKWSGPALKSLGTYPYRVVSKKVSADPNIIIR